MEKRKVSLYEEYTFLVLKLGCKGISRLDELYLTGRRRLWYIGYHRRKLARLLDFKF